MSDEDELRKAIRLALAQWAVVPLSHLGYIADAVLALPELAALIADAERVQRVRELAERWTWDPPSPKDRERNRYGAAIHDCGEAVRRALDGDL